MGDYKSSTTRKIPLSKINWERFHAKTVTMPTGCIEWTGAKLPKGYGRYCVGNPPVAFLAHRIAYERAKGPIPAGLTIDHLCGNPSCVNPDHLEAVSMRENNRRGQSVSAQQSRRTHCPHGHPYDENNTYWHRGHRQCLVCRRARTAEQNARRRIAGEVSS